MLFVREDIPSDLLAIENEPLEGLYVELNLRNDKWLTIVLIILIKTS